MRTLNRLQFFLENQQSRRPSEINLMARRGGAQDVVSCCALHDLLRLPYSKKSRRILPEMWCTLLSTGAMQLFIVEDRARPAASRTIAFGGAIFVTDEFCSQARSTHAPYLAVESVRRFLGRRLPALNRAQVARANGSAGLNLIMCFEGWAEDGFSREQMVGVREKYTEAFYLCFRGYRIKEFLTEPIGREATQWMRDAGARLRQDYSNYFQMHNISELELGHRPCLLGLTKAEAFAHAGTNIASLFIYTAPRFRFNRSQRVLLQHALMGETHEKLAESLSISPWTVKKRWDAIYERVADVDRDLLGPPIPHGSRLSSRGAERRRYLLNYLRQHFEELRPYALPSQILRSSSAIGQDSA
jgi:hypothetical protein